MKKPLARLKKEVSFEAAHYLHNPAWSRERNLAVFKRCSGYRAHDPKATGYPHGHTYRVVVTVEGPIDKSTGFVMDFRVLKDILKKEVHGKFDHRFLNKETEPFKSRPSVQPTAENIARVIFGSVKKPLKDAGVALKSVEVWETPESCALVDRT